VHKDVVDLSWNFFFVVCTQSVNVCGFDLYLSLSLEFCTFLFLHDIFDLQLHSRCSNTSAPNELTNEMLKAP
jgi:hypothetical protein